MVWWEDYLKNNFYPLPYEANKKTEYPGGANCHEKSNI
jgi:hypothetical protein